MGRNIGSVAGVIKSFPKHCSNCQKPFLINGTPGTARYEKRKFCSQFCYSDAKLKAHPIKIGQTRRERENERRNKWRIEHSERTNDQRRSKHTERKELIVAEYGGKCACCGESDFRFLTIDHVGNNGSEERKQGIRASRLYYKIIREQFPATYQILCYNCNCAKGVYGICPHQSG